MLGRNRKVQGGGEIPRGIVGNRGGWGGPWGLGPTLSLHQAVTGPHASYSHLGFSVLVFKMRDWTGRFQSALYVQALGLGGTHTWLLCLFSTGNGPSRAPSRKVSVCDDKCKLYWSPEEVTAHSKEVNALLKEIGTLFIWGGGGSGGRKPGFFW